VNYLVQYLHKLQLLRAVVLTSIRKHLEISVLVRTVIKALKQVAEMKHKLSASILIPASAILFIQLK